MDSPKWRQIAAAVIAALVALGVTVVVVDNGPDHGPTKPRRTVTVHLGGPGHRPVTLTPPAQAIVTEQKRQDAAGDEDAAHSDLHAEPDAATDPATLGHNDRLKPPGQPTIPTHLPQATPTVAGCRTLLVRNYSSRQGSPILLGVVHFTVSTDNGWAGVLGNVRWFDTLASSASSNEIVDRRIGACALVVPEPLKAWAQAGFNRVSVSVEVTARGNEGTLVVGAGRARLVGLLRGWHKRWHIPYRHGAVSGCAVTRTGFVMHRDLGACGGGHVDVGPYKIDDLVSEAARLDRQASAPPIRAVDRDRCRRLVWWRRQGRPQGGPREAKAIARRRLLDKRHLTCTARGVARAK